MDVTVSHHIEQAAFITFRCKSCGQEIEVQIEQAGNSSECPACGNFIKIPDVSEAGTLRGPQDQDNESLDAVGVAAMKSRTIRIELSDDF